MRELYIHNRSIIHSLDARVKLVFTLAFILFLNLTPNRSWPAYILFLALVFSIELISRLGIGFVLKRALLAVPFILAAVPVIFTRTPSSIPVRVFPGIQVVFSPEGFERFASFAIKSWISVQSAIVLASTTRFPDLLIALNQLKVPKVFIAILGLMWRYLFVISEEVNRMLRARKSRSAAAAGSQHPGGTFFWRARITGGMAGSLFLRSIERSERVYTAMLSRGYNGEPQAIDTTTLLRKDRRILILGIVVLALLWVLGVLTGG